MTPEEGIPLRDVRLISYLYHNFDFSNCEKMKNVDQDITVHLPGGGTIKRKSDLQLFKGDNEFDKVKQLFERHEEESKESFEYDDDTSRASTFEKVRIPFSLLGRIRLAHQEYLRVVDATLRMSIKDINTDVCEMYMINPMHNIWYNHYGEEGFEVISNDEFDKMQANIKS